MATRAKSVKGKRAARGTRSGRTGRDTRNRRLDIVEAAMRLFAEQGFDGTGMREIAKSARVSLGLVTQFYGTKDALHQAVDDHVLAEFNTRIGSLPDERNFLESSYRSVVKFVSEHQLLYRYIRRALVEGSPGSNEFFQRYHQMQVAFIRRAKQLGSIADDVDETWAAFILIFLALGPIFCMEQIETIVGKSVFDIKLIEHRHRIYARLLQQGFGTAE